MTSLSHRLLPIYFAMYAEDETLNYKTWAAIDPRSASVQKPRLIYQPINLPGQLSHVKEFVSLLAAADNIIPVGQTTPHHPWISADVAKGLCNAVASTAKLLWLRSAAGHMYTSAVSNRMTVRSCILKNRMGNCFTLSTCHILRTPCISAFCASEVV